MVTVHAGCCLMIFTVTGTVTGVAAVAGTARADNPPIVDRNYAIDLYDGVALGNSRMVGMGGTGAALITGTAGALINPSAIAVRATTDADSWDLTAHFDYLTGRYSSDYDNNGVVTDDDSGAALVTGGLGLRVHDWSGAVTFVTQSVALPGSSPALAAIATRWRLIVGNYRPAFDLALGAGIQLASFSLNEAGSSLFQVSGAGVVAGVTWLPRGENIRIGGALDLAISGGEITASCDPMSCRGHILPNEVDSPSRAVAGVAYRIGPTPWNQQVLGAFRDERAVTLAADLVVTGATPNGYGIEAFGVGQLQRSGKAIAVSPRGGAEYEAWPGRLRVRGGLYWEPSRFDGIAGRFHGTFGVELAVLRFQLFGQHRLSLSFTGDLAARYRNLGLFSIGFWH